MLIICSLVKIQQLFHKVSSSFPPRLMNLLER